MWLKSRHGTLVNADYVRSIVVRLKDMKAGEMWQVRAIDDQPDEEGEYYVLAEGTMQACEDMLALLAKKLDAVGI